MIRTNAYYMHLHTQTGGMGKGYTGNRKRIKYWGLFQLGTFSISLYLFKKKKIQADNLVETFVRKYMLHGDVPFSLYVTTIC